MSITQDQIQRIAEKLSKIPGDNEKLVHNIQDILGYMELLNEVDTTGVIPTVSVIETSGKLRVDKKTDVLVSPKELLNCSNQKVISDQIVLPNIMQ